MTLGNFFSIAFSTSPDKCAAAHTIVWTDDKSYLSTMGCLERNTATGGTRVKNVTFKDLNRRHLKNVHSYKYVKVLVLYSEWKIRICQKFVKSAQINIMQLKKRIASSFFKILCHCTIFIFLSFFSFLCSCGKNASNGSICLSI